MIETPNTQKNTKDSFCTIFNDLEKQGYRLITSGGAQELVFVFHKDGIYEAEAPIPEEVGAAEKKAAAKKAKKHDKK